MREEIESSLPEGDSPFPEEEHEPSTDRPRGLSADEAAALDGLSVVEEASPGREVPAEDLDGVQDVQGGALAGRIPPPEDPAAAQPAEPLLELAPEELRRGIEAVLFSSSQPIPVRQLAEVFEVPLHDVREAIEDLRLEYASSARAFRLEDIAGGVQVLTLPRYEPWIRRALSRAGESRLSPAAFETLAVIAYKQPINKADLEAIRGVQCGPILKTLLDKNLVKVVGREESLGKPLLYGTTRRFLESFGLSSISHLPQPELEAQRPAEPAGKALFSGALPAGGAPALLAGESAAEAVSQEGKAPSAGDDDAAADAGGEALKRLADPYPPP